MHRALHVPARRHPHQVLVALLLVLSGLPVLVGTARAGSLARTLPEPMVQAWAVTVVLGGMLVLAAAVWPSAMTPLYLEMVADLPLALMCTAYATAVFVVAGLGAVVSGGIVLAAAVAFAARFFQVLRTLSQIRHDLSEQTGERE